jgi:BREX protein BrxB
MGRIETLRRNYQRVCGLPWDRHLSGQQKVWIAVYDREDERKLRLRIGLFEESTRAVGHHWHRCDLTDAFADWLMSPELAPYANSYFEAPELLDAGPLSDFRQAVASQLISSMNGLEYQDDTVVAVTGVASLFGFTRVSEVLPLVEPHIQGRLLIFFPGAYEQNNYRLLDARDGWNYLAVPITAQEGEMRS